MNIRKDSIRCDAFSLFYFCTNSTYMVSIHTLPGTTGGLGWLKWKSFISTAASWLAARSVTPPKHSPPSPHHIQTATMEFEKN